jgi:hypothetical protein
MKSLLTVPWAPIVYPERPLLDEFDLWSKLAREVRVDWSRQGMPASVGLAKGPFQRSVRLRDLLFLAGVLGQPLLDWGALSAWAFMLKHYNSFGPEESLLVTDSVVDWDPREKGLFSEGVGLGFAGIGLMLDHGVVHVDHAEHYINEVIDDPVSPYDGKTLKSLGINGSRTPDFFCIDHVGRALICESKGRIGAPGVAAAAVKSGKEQVANVQPVGVPLAPAARIVFGTNLRHSGESVKRGSGVLASDPPSEPEPLQVPVDRGDLVKRSYARFFEFAGRADLAWSVRSQRPLALRQEMESRGLGDKPLLLGTVFGCSVLVDSGVLVALLGSTNDELYDSVTASLEAGNSRWSSDSEYLHLPNGVSFAKRADARPVPVVNILHPVDRL